MWKALFILAAIGLTGCAGAKKAAEPTRPGGQWIEALGATCYPPAGWTPEPLKSSAKHAHQIWLSSSGNTAYGVARFSLPLPMTLDLALWGFLREMKKTEGSAELIAKTVDTDRRVLRFEAVGGYYHVWGNLSVKGWQGWVCYAATRTGQTVERGDLDRAATAKEATLIGFKH